MSGLPPGPNLVPGRYRGVSVASLPPGVALDEDGLRAYFTGRDAYRRTRFVVARNSAESAAQALETSEAQFRVAGSLLKVGEATLGDQLAARSVVSSSAVGLLTANAEVIVSLEALAAATGMNARDVAGLLSGPARKAETP